jgi:TrmH family RNA methyltransferase
MASAKRKFSRKASAFRQHLQGTNSMPGRHLNQTAIPQITSKDNPLLKTIRLVSSESRRAPQQLVVAEGVRVLEEVQKTDCFIEAVLLSENFGADTREQTLLDAWQSNDVRLYQVRESLFKSLSSVQTPQGAIALVQVSRVSLNAFRPKDNTLILCASGVQDPGNLGTLIRTAAAADADMVCTLTGTVSARNPKAVRSSAGTFFRIPLVEHVDANEFIHYCETHSIQIYRTGADTGTPYTKADLRESCAIVLGNEGRGMMDDEFSKFPSLRIPIADAAESLNVAMAGAVLFFEAFRQRSTL